ncbi:hypothetical protein C8F01DRAFT_1231154 [Mycena amicta]|nr:hypothetical protein C8F01DRAFT_1231154 [Mycena amicta]
MGKAGKKARTGMHTGRRFGKVRDEGLQLCYQVAGGGKCDHGDQCRINHDIPPYLATQLPASHKRATSTMCLCLHRWRAIRLQLQYLSAHSKLDDADVLQLVTDEDERAKAAVACAEYPLPITTAYQKEDEEDLAKRGTAPVSGGGHWAGSRRCGFMPRPRGCSGTALAEERRQANEDGRVDALTPVIYGRRQISIKTCVDAVRAREVDEYRGLPRILIFGNGDCYSGTAYWETVDHSGVDAVMGSGGMPSMDYHTFAPTPTLPGGTSAKHFPSNTATSRSALGILERLPASAKLNERPPAIRGRDELETLLASGDSRDWVRISEMFLGAPPERWGFTPKHQSSAYESQG